MKSLPALNTTLSERASQGMPEAETQRLRARLSQANQLTARLERISADSVWAHRSSGYRGSLLKWIEHAEKCLSGAVPLEKSEMQHFEILMEIGLRLLENAAREKLLRRGVQPQIH
jgi:hypothetical protein